MAFADAEAHGLYSALALLRGFAIQLSYRWGLGTIMASADDRAVLLWSPVHRRDADVSARRTMLAMLVAVMSGVILFVLSNMILLIPIGIILRAAGMSPIATAGIRAGIVAVRLFLNLLRALRAYRHDARLLRSLPSPRARRWRLDYMAAVPARAGHGTRLLTDFLRLADDRDAEITLNCEPALIAFYRRHGFRPLDSPVAGQAVMLRSSQSERQANGRRNSVRTARFRTSHDSSRETRQKTRPVKAGSDRPARRTGGSLVRYLSR
jgi:hypothetical protein